MYKRFLVILIALLLVFAVSVQALTSLNQFATCRFETYYACYSGPGNYYYRANNGKATYGGGGVARLYGIVDGWLMIGYQLGSGDYRIGYIEPGAINKMYDLKGSYNSNLQFDSVAAVITKDCNVTDDPVINMKPVLALSVGDYVTWLGTMGTDWAYIEVVGSSSLMRGFVRSHCIAVATDCQPPNPQPQQNVSAPNTYYHDYNKGEYLPNWQQVRFPSKQAIYSGPGTYYYRANNGKALMGGGVCRLYGVEAGWALIGYELNNGTFRLGYLPEDAVPQLGLQIPYLDLIYSAETILTDTHMTDDVVISDSVIKMLKAGDQVTFLGLIQGRSRTWAFVEVVGQNIRGFVPASSLGR